MKLSTWKIWFFGNIVALILFVVLSPLVFNVLPASLLPHLTKIWGLFLLSTGLSILYGLNSNYEEPEPQRVFKLVFALKGTAIPITKYCDSATCITPYLDDLKAQKLSYLDISYIKNNSIEYLEYLNQ